MSVIGSSLPVSPPLAAVLLAAVLTSPAGGYETDQFTHRLSPIEDSAAVLNARVNETIERIASEWRWGRDEMKFCRKIYHVLGGHHWVDKLERWAMKSPDVDRIRIKRRQSIYWGHPPWATRVAFLFGIGVTIKVNGVHLGSDKIGHFFSQGLKFYRRFRRSGSEEAAAKRSIYTERALFGKLTTGSYSNADLVANYEGHRFYRSLFEDDITGDKPAILRWEGDRWIVQRPFDWADYVNDYWDEALNINEYDRMLRPRMQARLASYCDDFYAEPEKYRIEDEPELERRYAHIGLRDTTELRLDRLCESQIADSGEPPEEGHAAAQ